MPWPVYLFFLVLVRVASTTPPVPTPSASASASFPAVILSASPTPRPVESSHGQMTMFSVYAGTSQEDQQRQLTLRCRLDHAVSNVEPGILVTGTIAEDVLGDNGSILIPAGSKVVGHGFCDAERARFLGRGRWTCFVGDHQISALGILMDAEQKEGLTGTELVDGVDPLKVKQAIYRDGIFLCVPAGTEFLIRLQQGNVSIQELGSTYNH
jgi:hypothetical protein